MQARELKINRTILGLTQQNIADIVGCSIRTVKRMEASETKIPKLLIDYINNEIANSKKEYDKKKEL